MKNEVCYVSGRARVDQLLATAQEHLIRNEHDAAEKVLLESLREKETPAAWRGMASVHCLKRDLQKAVETAEKAVELDESDHLSLGMLGHVLHLQEDFVNAFGFYALAARAGPNVLIHKQKFADISEKISFPFFEKRIIRALKIFRWLSR